MLDLRLCWRVSRIAFLQIVKPCTHLVTPAVPPSAAYISYSCGHLRSIRQSKTYAARLVLLINYFPHPFPSLPLAFFVSVLAVDILSAQLTSTLGSGLLLGCYCQYSFRLAPMFFPCPTKRFGERSAPCVLFAWLASPLASVGVSAASRGLSYPLPPSMSGLAFVVVLF